MGRTRVVIWRYDCDTDGHRPSLPGGDPQSLEVAPGDGCSTWRGTVVHDQADADAMARQAGNVPWQPGGHCAACCGQTGYIATCQEEDVYAALDVALRALDRLDHADELTERAT